MTIHQEIRFEDEVCSYLAAHGWLNEANDAGYDPYSTLYPADVVAWVQQTQPDAWDGLTKTHGANAGDKLVDRLRKQIEKRGAVDVLRCGIELHGASKSISLAQFKPASGINGDILKRYEANRLRVVRQVRYSKANNNSLDLVLFLNGIPVATAELKTDFTQSVGDAVDQYRFDRLLRSKGAPPEPLLDYHSGAIVHFAVSTTEVMMTTRLDGPATRFVPFNRGNQGGAGNESSDVGYPTAYLWEEVWQRESWLEIVGRYMISLPSVSGKPVPTVFPRFHQLDATRRLRSIIATEGPGGRYLVQHSAGSGKTNSIAWTAHFLADLHDDRHHKVFDSVIVISDRNVIDAQLSKAIYAFERTSGVVASITNERGAKGRQLNEALDGGKKIVICTIQTFPFAFKEAEKLSAKKGRRFAIVVDEAHSSQTGEAALRMKQGLTSQVEGLENDPEGVDSQDAVNALIEESKSSEALTYIAFTATPKGKTLELFGRRPKPNEPASETNRPEPFHVYSMRQAIEEGHILDVLRNYTPYSVAYRLAHEDNGAKRDEVDRGEAVKSLLKWVKLHDYNIAQKVQIIVEHYRSTVQPLIEGKAKAMVVVSSRLEAVRWKVAIEKYIASKGYDLGTLVAFSGEVEDPPGSGVTFAETGEEMNPRLKGRDIRDAFDTPGYNVLLVASKFQTGFDQPLLCGMYVDKRLDGIQAVQTLSRLNRSYPGKDQTYILDFVNDPAEVLKSFRRYYQEASLEAETDPDLIYDLKARLDAADFYQEAEVNRVAAIEASPKATQRDLVAAIEPVAARLLLAFKVARQEKVAADAVKDVDAFKAASARMESLHVFKKDVGSFLRLHSFLSQIFDYGNSGLDKRAVFFRRLLPLLSFGREREQIDTSDIVLTHHALRARETMDLPLGVGESEKLKPVTDAGTSEVHEREKVLFAKVLEAVNGLFPDVTDGDAVSFTNAMKIKLLESDLLKTQAANNSKQQFSVSPDLTKAIRKAAMDAGEANRKMTKTLIQSPRVQEDLKRMLLEIFGLYEALKE